MRLRTIQEDKQEVRITLDYFAKTSELELVVRGDMAVVRPKSLVTLPDLHQNERRAEMLAQTAVFETRLAELRQTHLGEYVAFHEGELVDHDADHHQLSQRIKARFPNAIVLIRQVTVEPERPLRLGSPRLTHNP